MVQAVPPPIIRSSKTVYTASDTLSHLFCYLPLSWQVAVKVWQSTRCCINSFWAPDDGRGNRLKHVEHFTEINKLCNVASCWLYLEVCLRCMDPWTSNSIWQRLPCITNRHNQYEKFCNLEKQNVRIYWKERADMTYLKGPQIPTPKKKKICDLHLNSRHQLDDMKQVPHWEPTVLWCPQNLAVIWRFLLGACALRRTFFFFQFKEISCSMLQILGARDFRNHNMSPTE